MTALSPAAGWSPTGERLRALQTIEARHRAALVISIRRAERAIRLAETLDDRFDRRFAALVLSLANESERSTHVPASAI